MDNDAFAMQVGDTTLVYASQQLPSSHFDAGARESLRELSGPGGAASVAIPAGGAQLLPLRPTLVEPVWPRCALFVPGQRVPASS